MRKFGIFLCITLLFLIIAGQTIDNINYKKELNTVYSPQDLNMASTYTAITISAVGDCTLATDINYAGVGSFDNEVKSVSYDYSHFLKNVRDMLQEDDLTIINFEGTMSQRGERAEKEYSFRGNPEYVNILTTSSVEVANLSNNHTYDYGDVALRDTKATLEENGIIWYEGKNITVTEVKGLKIGFIGVNTQRSADTNNFLTNLEKLKAMNPDLIIASFHWGTERSYVADNSQIAFAHKAIDNGADLVIGHHPHVLQGIEKYNGKYIVYSLGNFCFGGSKNPADKDTMIFRQTFFFDEGKLVPKEDVSVIPCSISSVKERNNYQPTPLLGEEFKRVKDKIIDLSASFGGIEKIKFIEKK